MPFERLRAEGILQTVPSKPKRPVHPMEEAVKTALEKRGLMAACRARPPYPQNDYLGWIRSRRICREGNNMELGTFSVSLAVKDLTASRSFYEKLGFSVFAGDASQNWLILKNGDCVIGLFQGMFERNMLTFNPGWDGSARALASFTDVRELQRQLKALGVPLTREADEDSSGPASFVVVDPDGNPILVDQHV